MKRSIARGIVMLLLVVLGQTMANVEAAPVRSFFFSGNVDSVSGTPFNLTVNPGDPISGTLTYDAGVPATVFSTTVFGYRQSIVGGISALVGGRTYSSNNFTVLVENDRPVAMVDGYNAHSDPSFNPSGDLFEGGNRVSGTISVNALDFTGSLLSSPSLLDLDPMLFNSRFQLLQDNSNFFQASITLRVLTPQDAIDLLKHEVEVLVDAHTLNHGQGNSLNSKLDRIMASTNRGNTRAACNQLSAFISQVDDLVGDGILPPSQGQLLIGFATVLSNTLGC